MSDARIDRVGGARRGLIAALVMFAAMAWFASSAAATPVSSEPDDAGAATTEVRTTEVVDTTEVLDTTSPPTTDLDDVATTGEPVDGLIGADPDPDSSVALLAVVGLVVVLSLAAWWMVRRDDDRPVPDPPEGELI
jgi:hypothetical protein